jgi:hypothetical protein
MYQREDNENTTYREYYEYPNKRTYQRLCVDLISNEKINVTIYSFGIFHMRTIFVNGTPLSLE